MAQGDDFTTRLLSGEMTDDLVEAVYEELHGIAENKLRGERADHLLQPTALVHEAYLRMVDINEVDWKSRTHFRAMAAIAIQRVLIDHARKRNRQKRSGQWRKLQLHDAFHIGQNAEPIDVEELYMALDRLRDLDDQQSRVVELRVFSGLTTAEIASVVGVSTRTVEREWRMGLAWLRRALGEAGDDE